MRSVSFACIASLEPYDDVPLPDDYQEKTEWIFARLMYPPHPNARFGRRAASGLGRLARGRHQLDAGLSARGPAFRAGDAAADAHHARSVEQPVNLDDGDDVYNWPWLCAGEMGDWKLTDAQAAKLREYLLRGGFLMLDDFWGTEEWDRFEESMQRVFPDRQIVEIDD